jgi:acetyltransferase-like isoleucine patch superfamily enzyme
MKFPFLFRHKALSSDRVPILDERLTMENPSTSSETVSTPEEPPQTKRPQVGNGSYVDKTVHVLGWDNILIGNNTAISEYTCFNINLRDTLRLRIGDNCFIGRRNFFSTGDFIDLGDYCLTGPNCSFLNAGHVTDSPFVPYIVSGIESYGRLAIGTNCWLTSNVTVIGGVSIGYGSIVGSNSLVTESIPPLAIALGAPARIAKLFDRTLRRWRNIDDFGLPPQQVLAQHIDGLPSEDEYKAIMKEKYPTVLVPQVAAGLAAGEI